MKNIFENCKILSDEKKCSDVLKGFLTSPVKLAAFLLFVVLFMTFVIYYPSYGTADDPVMSILASGIPSANIEPSGFLLYSNILYGTFLKTLYLINNNIDWYDLVCYSLQSLALFVTAFTIFDKTKIRYNIFALIVLFGIFTPLFLEEQFTTYTGVLVISAVSACIYMLKNNLKVWQYIIGGIYVTIMLSVASLVRFNAFCIILLFGALCSLFLVKKDEIKKLHGIIALIFFTSVLAFSLVFVNDIIVKNNQEFYEYGKKNESRAALFNDSIAGTDIFVPWRPVESKVIDLDKKLSQVGWTKGDYRLLLTWSDIGDMDIFTLEKMNELAKILKKDISISHNFKLKFKIEDYRKVLNKYLLILVLSMIIFVRPKQYLKPALILLSFFILEILLDMKFRQTPYRLWVNFITIAAVIMYSYFKYYLVDLVKEYEQKIDKNTLKILVGISLILVFNFSMSIADESHKYSRNHVQGYKIFDKQSKRIDDNKIYILSAFGVEVSKIPFKRSIFFKSYNKFINMGMSVHPQLQKLFGVYNIPKTKTWDYICSNPNVEFAIVHKPCYDYYFDADRLAIFRHMKDRYNKDVTFVEKQNSGDIKSYSCEVMTKEDIELAKRMNKVNSYNNLDYYDNSSSK